MGMGEGMELVAFLCWEHHSHSRLCGGGVGTLMAEWLWSCEPVGLSIWPGPRKDLPGILESGMNFFSTT